MGNTCTIICFHSLRDLALTLASVVSYALRATFQIKASLADDSRDTIYNNNMFIVQATDYIKKALY